MRQEDPKIRPTAAQCLEQFQDIKSRVSLWALLSPTSNMLYLYYYENPWQMVKDKTRHRLEYLRLLAKAVLTKKGQTVRS